MTTMQDIKTQEMSIVERAVKYDDFETLRGLAQAYAEMDDMPYATYLLGLAKKAEHNDAWGYDEGIGN